MPRRHRPVKLDLPKCNLVPAAGEQGETGAGPLIGSTAENTGTLAMNRRRLLVASLAGLGLVAAAASVMASAPAVAPPHVAFDRAAFEQAQAADKRILIDVHAPWCPTCRAQEPIIERLSAARGNENLIVFRVDFDGQKAEVRRFGAQRQSTLIAYRGTRETGRLVADTNPERIAALVASTR